MSTVDQLPQIIRHFSQSSFAVRFVKNGREYQTSFTRFRSEAERWAEGVKVYGWCVSGRPCAYDAADDALPHRTAA